MNKQLIIITYHKSLNKQRLVRILFHFFFRYKKVLTHFVTQDYLFVGLPLEYCRVSSLLVIKSIILTFIAFYYQIIRRLTT